MAIVYFYGEDEKHYTENGQTAIINKYKLKDKLKVCFKENEIEELVLHSLRNTQDIFILTPLYFHFLIVKYFSFIKVIRLENEDGILTSQDKKLGITAEEKLKIKLNSSITKPKLTFADYGGAKDLVDETETINNFFKLGIPVKGIFLAGLPGTGKSFFAKCLAGQLNRYLIELNLTKFMKSDNSVIMIEEFFDFFKTNPGDYIIWLDEIEKMFTGTEESTQLLGTLLTKINDFNASASTLKSTAFVVATANNVYSLSHRNPEFFRNGRFDILISLNPPTDLGAKEIFEIYIKANLKKHREIFLNAVYLCFKNQMKISENENNNGFMKLISQYVIKEQKSIKTFIEEYKITNKKMFVNKIIKSENYFAISLIKDLEAIEFKFDIAKIIAEVFKQYRNSCQNQVRFPYVPAEIEYFVTTLYKHFLFNDIKLTDEAILGYINNIKPLQASMKDQLAEMAGVTSDFRQV